MKHPTTTLKLFLLTLFIIPYGIYFSLGIYYLLYKRCFQKTLKEERNLTLEKGIDILLLYGRNYRE